DHADDRQRGGRRVGAVHRAAASAGELHRALARGVPLARPGGPVMKRHAGVLAVSALIALVVGALSVFVVDQRQNAIVFRLGEVVDIKREAGLYFKIPIIEDVRYFDIRILTIDTAEPERFLT